MQVIEGLPVRRAERKELVGLDIEVFGQTEKRLHHPEGTFACISVAYRGDENVYQIYDTALLPELFDIISAGTWVFHNSIYDLRQLRRWVTIEPRFIWDTMLVEKSLWNGWYDSFGLKDLVRRYLSIHMNKETREHFIHWTGMDDAMKEYAALDSYYTVRVAECQARLQPEHDLSNYFKVDAPMIWVALDMPKVKVDVRKWEELIEKFTPLAKGLEADLGVNVMAFAKVKEMLNAHGYNVESTGEDVLMEAIGAITEDGSDIDMTDMSTHPIVKKILMARTYRTAVSRYGIKWLAEHADSQGMVLSDWKASEAKTGRMSSSNPGLQQIPSRKLPEYRELFISARGVLVGVDISQQEPRITACESNDKELWDAFLNGIDVHLKVARMVTRDMEMVKEDPRRNKLGKPLNLGLVYGLTAQGLSNRTGMPLPEAEKLLAMYFQSFKGVKKWIDYEHNFGLKNEFVTTAAKRRCWLNLHDYKWANNAINSPIQGGGADFTKRWMYHVWKAFRDLGKPFPIVLIVHDEALADVPEEDAELTKQIMLEAMGKAGEELYPGMPFKGDPGIGKTWREVHH
jgi:DNA polymerase I